MEKKTFELDANDAAIIFKHDMSTEILLPKMGDDEDVTFDEHQNIFVAIAISGSMGDDDFRKVISAKLDTLFLKTDTACDDDKEAPACGSCCGCGPEEE